ncbi:UNKNOWN [Stylonychia lemnae]|uniref:RING-type domain-containing protein n=1 Tax=Stylonychia lemnae TaxID=5949 RepID=A0A077ZY35_STYLE|nr:UNKNOWN [Stylonychia lemnae]|eukprot:CDW74142.1 UNKNOWN [Stylonychia lemnae]
MNFDNYAKITSTTVPQMEDAFTPDGKKQNKDHVFDIKNVPMTSQAKARMLYQRPNSQMGGPEMYVTAGAQTMKRQISNAKDIMLMINRGELLNCYVCFIKPIEHYCNVCESGLCGSCKNEITQRNNACPHCRYREPVFLDIKVCKPLKSLIKKVKRNLLTEYDIQKAFKCKICKNLMLEPKSCQDCLTNFCQSCIQNKLCKENKCIECKINNPTLRKLHKSQTEILEKSQIQCRFCFEPQRYLDLINHEIDCPIRQNPQQRRNTNVKVLRVSPPGEKIHDNSFAPHNSSSERKRGNYKSGTFAKYVNNIVSRRESSKLHLSILTNEDLRGGQNMDISYTGQSENDHQSHNTVIMREDIHGERTSSFQQNRHNRLNNDQNISFLIHSNDSDIQKIHMSDYPYQLSPNTVKSRSSEKNSFALEHQRMMMMNVSEKSQHSSTSDEESQNSQEYGYEQQDQMGEFEYGQFDPENNSPGVRSTNPKRSSTAQLLKKQQQETLDKKSYSKEIFNGLSEWKTNFYANIHMENCSSDSLIFYFMFMLIGTFEMFMAMCVFFNYQVIENSNPNVPKFQVNHIIFASGVAIEVLYLLITRIYLGKAYFKYLRYKHTKLYCALTSIIQSIFGIIPSDMLIFFGYKGENEYEKKVLNLAWLRRIISLVRVSVQAFAISWVVEGEFNTTVLLAMVLYFVLLSIAICPQSSSYDAFSWYRRA